MFRIVFIFIVLLVSLSSYANTPQRHLNDVFKHVIFSKNIEYSKKYNPTTARDEVLRMRVFEPKGDSSLARSLVILTPGGGFVEHGEDWMEDYGRMLAKAGYVVAINAYRLSDSIATEEKFAEAIMKAVSDQRSVMDFFINDRLGENRFRVDLNQVFVGGHSAGGLTSMVNAYHDMSDSMNGVYAEAYAKHIGDARKQQERRKHISIKGVINLSACIPDLNWIDSYEAPIIILHGTEDRVVSAEKTSYCSGGKAIRRQGDKVAVKSVLYLIDGADHNEPSSTLSCPECLPLIKRFMLNQMAL